MTSPEKKWYAIYTNPRAEKKTAEKLTEKGIEIFLPLQITLKQWSDRKKKVEEPLFKSYVFVFINIELERLSVLETPGVVKFVRIGGEVPVIRTSIIDAIKLSLAHFSDIEITNQNLYINQHVQVIAGPLRGYTGKILEQHGNQYFAVHIEELGAHMLLKIPAQYLQTY
ncbi:MAG: UpxY family transcription antiterminator [Bacteroidia bacterium]